jgi:exonuclease SbcC
LRISAFRGINTTIKLEPGSKSLLIIANNGNGKSSILQAIEWCLFGEIPSLEGEEFRREDALVNLFDTGGLAVVQMIVADNKHGTIEISRERKRQDKTSGKSSVTVKEDGGVYKGANAEERIRQFLDFSLDEYDTMVHLHQEVVREIIEGNEESRDKAINKILGIDALSDFGEVITKHAHQSSTANKSLRGLQKTVGELGIERNTKEKTKKDMEKQFEKIKAKLVDKGIDISKTAKERESLLAKTTSELLKTASNLEAEQLRNQIIEFAKQESGPIEERVDRAVDARRILRSTIQAAADKAKENISELELLEKQRDSYLKQLTQSKIDKEKDIGAEIRAMESEVAQKTKDISDLQQSENKLTEIKNSLPPLLDRITEVSTNIEKIENNYGDENEISKKQDLLDKQETALNIERTNLGTYNTLINSATKYIKVSKTESCPVCDKPIISENILSSLNRKLSDEIAKRLEENDKSLNEVRASKEELASTKKELKQLSKDKNAFGKSLLIIAEKFMQITGLEMVEPYITTVENKISELQKNAMEKKSTVESLKSRMDDLKRASTALEEISKVQAAIISIVNFKGDKANLQNSINEFKDAQKKRLSDLVVDKGNLDALNEEIDLLEDIITFEGRSSAIITIDNDMKELDAKLVKQQQKLAKINDIVEALSEIRDAVNSVKMESLATILSGIHDEMNEFYSKLNVNPMFGEIDLVPEERKGTHIYRIIAKGGKGKYKTFVRTRFSQAQRNLVAISLFLAMANHSPAKMVILDDPSQSLDEAHKKKFAEVLGILGDKINVVLATQDEAFGKDVIDQFPASRLDAYRLSGWNQNGPMVEKIISVA